MKVRRASQEQWDFLDRQRHSEVSALQEDRKRLAQQLEELKGQLKAVRCASAVASALPQSDARVSSAQDK